jgi:histidinol-phosphate aminotransferase/imidazoleglycerol-phosphate dehydratase/histidinol-phosphatase
MTLPASFPPLVTGGDGLDRYPAAPTALAARMAAVYAVPADHVLPVRGATHGLELVFRLAVREGLTVEAPLGQPYDRLAAIYGVTSPAAQATGEDRRPSAPGGGDARVSDQATTRLRGPAGEVLNLIDEGAVEFADTFSLVGQIASTPNLIVLRSLSLAYGLAGARIGAVIAQPAVLDRLRAVLEPHALPEPSVRLAMQALDPSRQIETRARIAAVQAERTRLVQALAADAEAGPFVRVQPDDLPQAEAALRALAISFERAGQGLRLPVSAKAEVNDRLLAALGLQPATVRPARQGQAIRDTHETRIVCAVDLDASGPVVIQTGVGFFDHMLEQVAAHGGFSLRLACEGDLHTDPHHTIEDSAIALGQALKQALGERRGIARYGFVLPMDEAEAAVSIDLSGRPYPVFEGRFDTPFIGDYRTDMTAHVFRSLAEHLGAAIHVSVTGTDDHHKTEACYKAFGRALRQAIRIEGEAVPSTKGVL